MGAVPATWAGVAAAMVTLVLAVVSWRVSRSRTKRRELDEIEEQIKACDDPSIASMLRERWWLRKRRS